MSSVKELSQKLDKIKKREENKKCFDCGEKGTTYVCIDFGTFICSRCAGILRELNYKVKGTGVSIFNQKEIDILEKNGNEVAQKLWLAKYKEGKDKRPNTKNDDELRDFLRDKYKNKKWYKKAKKSSGDDEENDDDKKEVGKEQIEKEKRDKEILKEMEKKEKERKKYSNINRIKEIPIKLKGKRDIDERDYFDEEQERDENMELPKDAIKMDFHKTITDKSGEPTVKFTKTITYKDGSIQKFVQ